MRIHLLIFVIAHMLFEHAHAQTYTDVAAEYGIDVLVENNNFGSGMSFYDFDKDGWDDLSFTQTNGPCRFFKNEQGEFVETDSFVYGSGQTKHLLWVDFDNDGDADIFTTAHGQPYRLYENTGNFNFTEISQSAGLAQTDEKHYGASFGDYNNDGFLDFYVCTYRYEGTEDDYDRLNHLYRNNGDGTFTDVTMEAGVEDGITMSFGSVWIDYNKDGYQDLYVINDKIYPNKLYENNGDGTFTNVSTTSQSGIVVDAMTATVGDYNNDTELDIYITNTPGGNRLLKGNSNYVFTDVSDSCGDILDAYSWGGLWVDYNNNGYQDLYVSTFNPLDQNLPNEFYINNADGTFTNNGEPFVSNHNANSLCPVTGDMNNDGAPEIAVHNRAPYEPFLWLNSGADGNYVKVTLEGEVSNKDGIGSWIHVYCGDDVYTRYTMCGENYIGQSSQHTIIGLGTHEAIDSLKIKWLSGIEDVFYDVEPNQSIDVMEGESITNQISLLGEDTFVCQGDSLQLDAGDWDSYLWSTGDTTRYITLSSTSEVFVEILHYGIAVMSDTLSIEFTPPPAIDVGITHVTCNGLDNGEISLENNNGFGIDTVIWNGQNLNGNPLSNLANGNYTFTLIDTVGCSQSGLAQVTEPETLGLVLETSDATEEFGGSAEISEISGGSAPYFVIWSNSVTETLLIDELNPGDYHVQVTDSNLCSYKEHFSIDLITGLQELQKNRLLIFPNPAEDQLFIKNAGNSKLSVISPSGKTMLVKEIKDEFPNPLPIAIDRLPSGCYIIQIENANSTQFFRLVVI